MHLRLQAKTVAPSRLCAGKQKAPDPVDTHFDRELMLGRGLYALAHHAGLQVVDDLYQLGQRARGAARAQGTPNMLTRSAHRAVPHWWPSRFGRE